MYGYHSVLVSFTAHLLITFIQVNHFTIFNWDFGVMVTNNNSDFRNAYVRASLEFNHHYPQKPPKFFIRTDIIHPNVLPDGEMHLPILQEVGEAEASRADATLERWDPTLDIASVIHSALRLLDTPDLSLPTNPWAAFIYRNNRDEYRALARRAATRSLKEVPLGFSIPEGFGVANTSEGLATTDSDVTMTEAPYSPGSSSIDDNGSNFDTDSDASMDSDVQEAVNLLLEHSQTMLSEYGPSIDSPDNSDAESVVTMASASDAVSVDFGPPTPRPPVRSPSLPREYYGDNWWKGSECGFWEREDGDRNEDDNEDDVKSHITVSVDEDDEMRSHIAISSDEDDDEVKSHITISSDEDDEDYGDDDDDAKSHITVPVDDE
jgi:ubiquitin-conjugating enzyme E2 G2